MRQMQRAFCHLPDDVATTCKQSTHKLSTDVLLMMMMLPCSGADEVNDADRQQLLMLDERLRTFRRQTEVINKGKVLASQVLAGLAGISEQGKAQLQQLEDAKNMIQKNMRIKVAL